MSRQIGQNAIALINAVDDGQDYSNLTRPLQENGYESAIHLLLRGTRVKKDCEPKLRKSEIITRQADAIRLFSQLVERQRKVLQFVRTLIQQYIGTATASISTALLTALGYSGLTDASPWKIFGAPTDGFQTAIFGSFVPNAPTTLSGLSPSNATITPQVLSVPQANVQISGSGTTVKQVVITLVSIEFQTLLTSLILTASDIVVNGTNFSLTPNALANLVGTGLFTAGTANSSPPSTTFNATNYSIVPTTTTSLTVNSTYYIGLDPFGQWKVKNIIIIYS